MEQPTPPDGADSHLSRISTNWDLLAQAHGAFGAAAATAQHSLLLRYGDAVYRYLLLAVRDPHTADDLSQEFAVRWLSGGFQNADPTRGRFRGYLSTALHHLVIDYYRRRQAEPDTLKSGSRDQTAAAPDPDRLEVTFLQEWRQGVLDAAWRELQRVEAAGDGQYYTVLRWRATHPDAPMAACADELSARLGKAITAAGVRQTLHRARKRYAELLVEEVARSLGGAPADVVEEELGLLGLLSYCRPNRRA
jgi:RNA polymerase sigma factor (sigma-70 family)